VRDVANGTSLTHTCRVSVGKSSDAAIGSELAGYLIEVLIGRGGMGALYRAEELVLGRKVALKVIALELAEDDREFRELVARALA
jgi:serine/threonine protein kinase